MKDNKENKWTFAKVIACLYCAVSWVALFALFERVPLYILGLVLVNTLISSYIITKIDIPLPKMFTFNDETQEDLQEN